MPIGSTLNDLVLRWETYSQVLQARLIFAAGVSLMLSSYTIYLKLCCRSIMLYLLDLLRMKIGRNCVCRACLFIACIIICIIKQNNCASNPASGVSLPAVRGKCDYECNYSGSWTCFWQSWQVPCQWTWCQDWVTQPVDLCPNSPYITASSQAPQPSRLYTGNSQKIQCTLIAPNFAERSEQLLKVLSLAMIPSTWNNYGQETCPVNAQSSIKQWMEYEEIHPLKVF